MAIELLTQRGRKAYIGEPSDTGEPQIILQFDATPNETHTSTAEVTKFPVEDGADNTDHIRKLPDLLELSVRVSNSPIIALASVRAEPAVAGGDPATRAEDTYAKLEEIQEAGQLVTVFTTLKTYENMAIASIVPTRDKDTGNVLDATISFEEITKAVTEQVEAPEHTIPNRKRKKKRGKKSTKPADDPTANKNQSLLTQLLGAFFS